MPQLRIRSLPSRTFAFLRARPRLAASLGLSALGLASLAAGLGLGIWNSVCRTCPSIAQIYVWEPKQSTKIFGANGTLIAQLGVERRTHVPLDALPPYVPQAFIAIEDKRFYQHHGLDFRGIARAAFNLILYREIRGGGSTITQQLARNMFIQELGFDQRFTRKLKEAKVALELEQVYSKQQILEAYINQINYCYGCFGIEAASRRFFGKSAVEANPAQAALLAAVINLPGHYNPFRYPDRARARRNLVLTLMADQGYLAPREAERWKQEPLPEQAHGTDEGDVAPYFVEWVRRRLDDRYGADLYQSGFRIYTTLDIGMQRKARAAMEAGWRRVEARPAFDHPTYDEVEADSTRPIGNETPYLQGMFLALDPRTGEIKAMIGGRDHGDSKFNRATQALRQPGSVFKPFVYTAAITSGIPASHVIYDSPLMLEQPDSTTYAPRNYTNEFSGPVTLRDALRRSINVVTIKLALQIGLETVVQTAHRMGIETPIPRFPSTAIGAASVIPLQVAEAYTAFATQGVKVEPRGIRRVEDATGKVLWRTKPERERVIQPLPAAIMLDLLRDVVDTGSGYNVRRPTVGHLPYELAAAGKTGTTDNATDVWFSGFTPDLLAVVWFGFDMPQQILPNAAGGAYAAPVWADFMNAVYYPDSTAAPAASAPVSSATAGSAGAGTSPRGRPIPPPWQVPRGLVTRRVDMQSGKLATEWCPTELVYTELYLPGTAPTEACDLHGPGLFGAPLRGVLPDTMLRGMWPDTTRRGPGPDIRRRRGMPDTAQGRLLPNPRRRPDTTRRPPPPDTTRRSAPPDTTRRGALPDTTRRRPPADAAQHARRHSTRAN